MTLSVLNSPASIRWPDRQGRDRQTRANSIKSFKKVHFERKGILFRAGHMVSPFPGMTNGVPFVNEFRSLLFVHIILYVNEMDECEQKNTLWTRFSQIFTDCSESVGKVSSPWAFLSATVVKL